MARRITRVETAIDKAFKDLEEYNIKTGTPKTMMYNCCQTCSWGNFEDDDKHILFYHIPDLDTLRDIRRENKKAEGWNEDTAEEYLYLAWRTDMNTLENVIFPVFKKYGIKVSYDGTPKTRLRVSIMDLVDQVENKDNVEVYEGV